MPLSQSTPPPVQRVQPEVDSNIHIPPERVMPEFFKFNCPACEKPTAFPGSLAGTVAPCPACGADILVPAYHGGASYIAGHAVRAKDNAKAKASGTKLIQRPPSRTAIKAATPLRTEPIERKKTKSGNSSHSAQSVLIAVALSVTGIIGVLILMYFVLRKSPVPELAVKETKAVTAALEPQPLPANASKPAPANDPAKPEIALAKSDSPSLRDAGKAPVESPPALAVAKEEPVLSARGVAPAVSEAKQETAVPAAVDTAPAVTPAPTAAAAAPVSNSVPDLLGLQEKRRQTKPDDEVDETTIASRKPAADKEAAGTAGLGFGLGEKGAENPIAAQSKGDAARKAAAEPKALPVPAVIKPVDTVCAACLGRGFVPNQPAVRYVHVEGEPAPNPMLAVPWKFCPKCQVGKDPKTLIAVEADRIAAQGNKTNKWKADTGLPMVFSETHHVSFYGPNPQTTKKIADTLEDLTLHLEKITGATLLTQSRPDTHEIIMVNEASGYNAIIDALAKQSPGTDFTLARKVSCISDSTHAFYKAQGIMAENMALFVFASMLMRQATESKVPPWMQEGFSSYCENAITKKNVCRTVEYEMNEVKLGNNWDADMKKFARDGKLKPWDQIFPLHMEGIKAIDYASCYSIVSFLIKTDPQRFDKLVLNIRDGMESGPALEKAYGRKVKDLQIIWFGWIQQH